MKKTLFLIGLFLNATIAFSQEIYEKPVVDERMELMSTVFRLVGTREYVSYDLPMYTNEVDKYFEKYKNHPLIEYSTTLLSKFGVSYNAVAEIALLLEIKNKKLKLRQDVDLQKLDERWQRDSIPKYMVLLNDFYKKTKFHDFYVKTENIRKIAEENFAKEITDKVDFDWFKRFFRVLPARKFRIIISLLNGGSNYGPTLFYNDGTEEYYAIMGTWQANYKGFPKYEDKEESVTNTLIHELSHSFTTPFLKEYEDKMMEKSNIFFDFYEEKIRNQGYGEPRVFIYETFVRACAIQYEIENNKPQHKIDMSIAYEINNGWLWIPQLLEAFKKYENDTIYKTFYDFMPEVVKLQNSLDPQQLYDEIENNKPIITTNIETGSDSVDYNIDNITLYFSKPMFPIDNGFTCCGEGYAEIDFTNFSGFQWNKEGTEYKTTITLEPDSKYYFGFPNYFFMSLNYLCPKNSCDLIFQTKKIDPNDTVYAKKSAEKTANQPIITGTSIENGSDNVDYNIDRITLFFNKPMYKSENAILNLRATPELDFIENGKWRDRIIGKNEWNEEGTEWAFYVKNLNPNTEYRIFFPKESFLDAKNNYNPKDNYILTFKTRKK